MLRCVLAKELILDHTGKLEQMNRATGYNDDAGIEFGEEIEAEAAKLDEKFNAEEREMIEWLRGKVPVGGSWMGWVDRVGLHKQALMRYESRYKESYFITDYIFTTNYQVSQDVSSAIPSTPQTQEPQ